MLFKEFLRRNYHILTGILTRNKYILKVYLDLESFEDNRVLFEKESNEKVL